MRLLRMVIITFTIGLILGLCFIPSYGKYIRLRRYMEYLESEVARLQEEVVFLSRQIVRAKNDPSFMEEVARKKYKMGSPGETIYVVKDIHGNEQMEEE